MAKDMLPEVRMKEELPAEMASLLQTRDKLVKLRTTLKNKINDLLSARGILLHEESLSTEKGPEQVLQAAVSVGQGGTDGAGGADSESEPRHCQAGSRH